MTIDWQHKILSDLIYDQPGRIEDLLAKHGYKIKGKTTYPKLNEGTVKLANSNSAFRSELTGLLNEYGSYWIGHNQYDFDSQKAAGDKGFQNFIDPVSLGLAAAASLTAVASSVVGAILQKKVREQQQALALLQLNQNAAMQKADIDAMADSKKKEIMLNTAISYKNGLDLIASKDRNQEVALVFFAVAGISTAFFIRTLIVRF